MKYMGSKRFMLRNGLGKLITSQIPNVKRVVDPFCGSGAIVFYVAEQFNTPVLAADLQGYSVALAAAIVARDKKIDTGKIEKAWLKKALRSTAQNKLYKKAIKLEKKELGTREFVRAARKLCKFSSDVGPMWNAYGGYYYSPSQAMMFDYLIKNLPEKEPHRSVCLASLISAASKCAAAPGHTAQPFQPTRTAGKFILQSWSLDPLAYAKKALEDISPRFAKVKGEALVSDAFDLMSQIKETDLVVVDPPYSGVQYSRFYHVLETIARGECGDVSGAGRYPPLTERPQSEFSNISQSKAALERLLGELAKTKARVILTFPKGKCSNGLSGRIVRAVSQKFFTIKEELVHGHFSTLGGNNVKRKSRKKSEELLLLLEPIG